MDECVLLDASVEPARLSLCGNVNIYAALRLKEAALELLDRQGGVTIDCREATGLDTASLQILIALVYQVRSQARMVTMAGVGGALDGALRQAGMDGVLDWHRSNHDGDCPA